MIIDDEQVSIDRLTAMIDKYCRGNIFLAGSCTSVEEGIKGVLSLQPQLIFLDVQIHDKTGFDVLKQLGTKNFDVIFVTAYEKYAVQAFKFSAVDYLLKPVDPEDLKQAIERVQLKKSGNDLSRKFDALLENVEQLKQYTPPKKIVIPTINGFELLPVIDILRCQSDVNYTTIFMKDRQKLVVAKTLKEFEEMLADYNFYRIHNSHLVNLVYVKSYHKGKGGSVVMIDGTEIEVSTRRKEDFLQKLSAI